MDAVTIKLSGRVFNDVNNVSRYVDIIIRFRKKGMRIAIVTGGGDTARRYIEMGRQLSLSEAANDMLGIEASRLNAMLLVHAINKREGGIYPTVVTNLEEAGRAWSSTGFIAVGGLQPGQSTTMVATLVSEYLGVSTIINCANIDGLYARDPMVDPTATRIPKATISDVEKILEQSANIIAGTYELIDKWALSIMKRSRISMYIIDGKNPDALESVLVGKNDVGSLIVPY